MKVYTKWILPVEQYYKYSDFDLSVVKSGTSLLTSMWKVHAIVTYFDHKHTVSKVSIWKCYSPSSTTEWSKIGRNHRIAREKGLRIKYR